MVQRGKSGDLTFIFSSSFSQSTRLSSCTSCCVKASYVSHPNDCVRSFVDTAASPNCSCVQGVMGIKICHAKGGDDLGIEAQCWGRGGLETQSRHNTVLKL